MKKLILSTCIMAIFAGPASSESICVDIGELAGSIMTSRQTGFQSFNSVMEPFWENASGTESEARINSIGRQMVNSAFERPFYSTAQIKARTIIEFQSEWERRCYNAAE